MEEACRKAEELREAARAQAQAILQKAEAEAEREAELLRKKGLLEIEVKVQALLREGDEKLRELRRRIHELREEGPRSLLKEVLGDERGRSRR